MWCRPPLTAESTLSVIPQHQTTEGVTHSPLGLTLYRRHLRARSSEPCSECDLVHMLGTSKSSHGPCFKDLTICWGSLCRGPDIFVEPGATGGAIVLEPSSLPLQGLLLYYPSFKRVPHHGPCFLFYLSDCELRLGKFASSVLSLSPGKHMKDDRYCEFSPNSHCEGNEKMA